MRKERTEREIEEADVFSWDDKVKPKGEKRIGKVVNIYKYGEPFEVEFEDGKRERFTRFDLEHVDESKRNKPIRFSIREIVFSQQYGLGIVREEKKKDDKQFFPMYKIEDIFVGENGYFRSSTEWVKAYSLRKATNEEKERFMKNIEIANKFCDINLVLKKEELAKIIEIVKGKIDPKIVEKFQKIYDSKRITI